MDKIKEYVKVGRGRYVQVGGRTYMESSYKVRATTPLSFLLIKSKSKQLSFKDAAEACFVRRMALIAYDLPLERSHDYFRGKMGIRRKEAGKLQISGGQSALKFYLSHSIQD
jgi:hypothetical protein